ncbi:ATP-binding protein [Candidatus Saccharibacteria bacterium]|nr:ATP-binding protein [Candidatus Saccharibacteria bacterium]
MILRLDCENFYSIREKISLDFTSTGRMIDNSAFVSADVPGYKKSVSIVSAIAGPNASGKTSVLKAFSFIRHLICETWERPIEDNPMLLFEPHVETPYLTSKINVEFISNGKIFKLFIEFNKQRILQERLDECSKRTNTGRLTSKCLYLRKWNDRTKKYSLQSSSTITIIKKELRSDSSVIATAARLQNNKKIIDIYNYWKHFGHNIWLHGHRDIHNESSIVKIVNELYLKPNVKNIVINILRKTKTGINDIIREETLLPDGEKVYSYFVTHIFDQKTYKTKLEDESSGTKQLLFLLPYCIDALIGNQKNGAVIIDEIDAFIHPFMVSMIISFFTNVKLNKNKIQLIFSTTNTITLSELNKRQIFLCDKYSGRTNVKRFDSKKNIRNDINFLAKYNSGIYSELELLDDKEIIKEIYKTTL